MKLFSRSSFRPPSSPRAIALAYFAFGIAWILLTDALLLMVEGDNAALTGLQNIKGLVFVGGTALLLYLLLRYARRVSTAAQQGQQQSNRALTEMVEAAPLSVLLVSEAGHIVYANAHSADLFGYTLEDLVGLPIEQLVPEQFRELHRGQRADFARSPHMRPFGDVPTLSARRRDGSVFPAEIALGPLSLGGQLRVACFVRDVTRREKAEAEVHSLAKFPEENPNPVLRLRHDGLILYANAASHPLLAAWGCTVGEVAPQFWREQVAAALADEVDREMDVLHHSGVWVLSVAPVVEAGYVNLYGRDVTARRRAEDALRASEEQYRTLVEHAADGIFVANTQGEYLDVNSSACKMLGYSRAELLTMHISDVIPPDELAARPIDIDTLLAGRTLLSERTFVHKDGSRFPVEVSGTLLPGGYLLGMVRDISERKQAEAQTRKLFRTLAVLSDINQAIVRIRDVPTLLDRACTIAVEKGSFHMAWIGLIEPSAGPEMHLAAHAGASQKCFDALAAQLRSDAALPLPWFGRLRQGERVVNNDLGNDPTMAAWHEDARLLGVRSCIALPLLVAGEFRGALMLYAEETDFFDTDELKLLDEMALDIGFAIEVTEQDAQRTAAEQALRSSEQRFAQAFQANPLAVVIVDQAEGRILDANDNYLHLHGFDSREQCIGRTTRELNQWVDPAGRAVLVEQLQRDGVALAVEMPFRTQRGDIRMGRFSAVQLELDGEPCLLSMGEDVTEQREMQAAKEEQQALAEALRDTAAALTSTLDPAEVMQRILENAGHVVPHNAANIMLIEGDAARVRFLRGYVPSEKHVIENCLLSLESPVLKAVLGRGQPYIATGTAHERLIAETPWVNSQITVPIRSQQQIIGFLNLNSKRPDFFTEVHAARLRAFADYAAVAIENAQLYDEIQQHAAQLEERVQQRTLELDAQRAQLRAILEAMAEGVLYVENGEVVYVNPAFGNLLGYGMDEMQRSPMPMRQAMLQVATDDQKTLLDNIESQVLTGETWQGEMKIQRRSGTTFDAAIAVSPVPISGTDLPGHVLLIRDVSQERALQAQKDRFIAQASHELRTPVTTMNMRLFLLRSQPEQAAKHLDMLESESARMTQLVEDLLNVSRFERGTVNLNRRPMDINTLVSEVVESQRIRAEAKDIVLQAEVLAKPLAIQADPNRLHQVLTNLVVNAINYTPAGGKVWVRVQRPNSDNELYVQVVDTGIGIAPEMLPRLFEPFFREQRLKTPGTGLGLNIARHIMELHGGGIEVHSVKDEGSTFTMRLPIEET